MKTSIKLDIEDTILALEDITAKLAAMPMEDKVDLGARMKGILKATTVICDDLLKDEYLKPELSKKLLLIRQKDKEATKVALVGGVFKAVLTAVPTTRLDQKSLRVDRPKIFAEYSKPAEDLRLTYEPR